MSKFLRLENQLGSLANFLLFSAVFELVMYFASMLCFVGRPQVNSVWYHVLGLLHPVKAIFALIVSRRIPSPSTLIEATRLRTHNQLQYSQATSDLQLAVVKRLCELYTATELPLRIYSCLAAAAFALDCLASLIVMVFIGKGEQQCVYLAQMLCVALLFYCDIGHLLWSLHVSVSDLEHTSWRRSLVKAVCGFGTDLQTLMYTESV